jgi:DNA-directed RNA polymerase specialized sigma24 family protein
MNLVDAFRETAPVEGDSATRSRRHEAAALLYEELHFLAAKTWPRMDDSDRSDVASEVLVRMMNNGPRGCREGDPATDGAVRAYLRESIVNGLRDLLRRRKRVDMPEEFNPVDPGPETAEIATRNEAQRQLESLERELFDRLVPAIASETKAGPAFVQTVRQLRDIREQRLSVEELIALECAGNPGGETDRKKARNRLDQRFSRVFARVYDAIEARAARGEFDEEKARGLRLVLDSLRLRQ